MKRILLNQPLLPPPVKQTNKQANKQGSNHTLRDLTLNSGRPLTLSRGQLMGTRVPPGFHDVASLSVYSHPLSSVCLFVCVCV